MALPLHLPFSPMEALSVDEIPTGTQWRYEPKWDGFRCLASRDGEEIQLQSKSGRPMTRYFPELVAALAALKPGANSCSTARSSFPPATAFPSTRFCSASIRRQPHPQIIRRNAGPSDRVRPPRRSGRTLLTDEPLDARRELLEAFYRKYCRASRIAAAVASSTKLGEAKAWLRRSRRDARRRHRQAARILPIDRATAPACRRSRTTAAPTAWSAASAITKHDRRRLTPVGPLRQSRPAGSRRLHLDDQAAGQTRAHQKAQSR